MANTPAKGWPYPLGTDFVVDGDNAIRAVSEMLDARMGMYVITPTSVANGVINADGSVSGNAASGFVELRGVFTSRFRTYKVMYNIVSGGTSPLALRFMQGATQVIVTGGYASQNWLANGASLSGGSTTANYAVVGSVSSANQNGEVTVFDPTDPAITTRAQSTTMGGGLPGGAGILRTGAALVEDGIAFQKLTGATIGWFKVYGL